MSNVARSISDIYLTLSAALADDGGQGLAEYGLILGLVAVLCIAAVLYLSGNIQSLLSNTGSSI